MTPSAVLGGVLRCDRVLVRAVPGAVGAHVGLRDEVRAAGWVTSADHPCLAVGHSSTGPMLLLLPPLITATVTREFPLCQVLFWALEIHFFIYFSP